MTWQSVSEGIAQARREMGVRERRDVPQDEIASAVGVSVAAYSRWEKGQRVPREDDVRKLAAFFGVTPAYLRYGIPDAKPPAPAEAGGRFTAEKFDDVSEEAEADLAAEEAERASTTARRKRGAHKRG